MPSEAYSIPFQSGSLDIRSPRIVALTAALGLAALLYSPIERRIAGVRLLMSMKSEDRGATPRLGREVLGLKSPDGTPIKARLYGPAAADARISIVLGHGIHHLGIREPRLVRFAHHLASLGCRVLTPELSQLAEYRITAEGVMVLRSSVEFLGKDAGDVGLIGFSFSGGLALRAAEDASTSAHLRYVASIGGFHDLSRTLRFLATDEVEGPSGRSSKPAHEYGLLVLLVGHLDKFSLGNDRDKLKAAFLAWLKEDHPKARAHEKELTHPEAKRLFQLLETGQLSELAPILLPIIANEAEELASLSPAGRLADIQTKVILLHGANDDVVPPEETLFAAEELFRGGKNRGLALVTPLLDHVRVDNPASPAEKLRLIELISQLL